jgi:hypothetical protein
MKKLHIVVLAVLALIGCDGDGGPGGTSAPEDLVPVLDALCEFTERCEDLPPIASTDRGECIDILYWALTCRLVEEDDELVGTERVEIPLDAEAIAACAAFIEGLECGGLACTSQGTCPEAEACSSLFGFFGDDDDDDDRAGLGEECWPGGSYCMTGLYCRAEYYDEERHDVICAVCAPQLGDGDACEPGASETMCGEGLVCVQRPEGGAECEPLRADGESCTAYEQCESAFCGDGVCSSGGHDGDPCETRPACRWEEELTCIDGACTPLREVGEPCGQDDHCVIYRCDPADDRCGLAEGSTCSSTSECRSGFCDSYARVCTEPLANGEACSGPEWCESGHCDSATWQCATAPPRQPEGSPCTDATECEEGLSCDTVCYRQCWDESPCPEGQYCGYANRTMCLPLGEDGAGCDDDEGCVSGYCNDADQCGTRPGIGDPCFGYGDCYPRGYCSGGVCVERARPGRPCDSYDSCLQPYLCLEGRCRLISLSCEPASVGEQCTYLQFCDESSYCGTSFRCVRRVGLGESCSGIPNECEAGLYCAYDEAAGMTCQDGATAGDPCGAEMPCVDGTTCVDDVCTEETGEECTWSEDCPAGTFCDDRSERCIPLLGEGDACESHEATCQEGLFCSDDYPNVCVPLLGVGEECDDYYQLCRPELYCDDASYPYACAERPALGEACEDDTGCEPGATCSASYDGSCVERAAEGETCQTNYWDPYGSNCLEGLFCAYGESDYECFAPRELGETCSSSTECASGYCNTSLYLCTASDQCVAP